LVLVSQKARDFSGLSPKRVDGWNCIRQTCSPSMLRLFLRSTSYRKNN
jgi:hypothetical protein